MWARLKTHMQLAQLRITRGRRENTKERSLKWRKARTANWWDGSTTKGDMHGLPMRPTHEEPPQARARRLSQCEENGHARGYCSLREQ